MTNVCAALCHPISVKGDLLDRRRRARLHWYKAYTLVTNPSLVLDYVQKKIKEQKKRDLAMAAVVK